LTGAQSAALQASGGVVSTECGFAVLDVEDRTVFSWPLTVANGGFTVGSREALATNVDQAWTFYSFDTLALVEKRSNEYVIRGPVVNNAAIHVPFSELGSYGGPLGYAVHGDRVLFLFRVDAVPYWLEASRAGAITVPFAPVHPPLGDAGDEPGIAKAVVEYSEGFAWIEGTGYFDGHVVFSPAPGQTFIRDLDPSQELIADPPIASWPYAAHTVALMGPNIVLSDNGTTIANIILTLPLSGNGSYRYAASLDMGFVAAVSGGFAVVGSDGSMATSGSYDAGESPDLPPPAITMNGGVAILVTATDDVVALGCND
jgi:hypothetical protein